MTERAERYHSRHGTPVSGSQLPARSRSTSQHQTRIPSRVNSPRQQLNTPPPSTARSYQPPRPDLDCAHRPHVFDLEPQEFNGEIYFDRFLAADNKDWLPCDFHPCPNRYNPNPPLIRHEDRSWAVPVNVAQEEYIRGHLERIAAPVPQRLIFPPAGLSASGSQQPQQPPARSSPQEDPSTSVVNPPKTPTPPPAQPSTHTSRDPSRRPSPNPSPSPPPVDNTLDSDDEMSKATKAFDKVTELKADGSNWAMWATRVERAAASIGYEGYLTTAPTATQTREDSDLLNAIIGRLPDSIFRRYRKTKTSLALWTGLKNDYDKDNALTEASLEK